MAIIDHYCCRPLYLLNIHVLVLDQMKHHSSLISTLLIQQRVTYTFESIQKDKQCKQLATDWNAKHATKLSQLDSCPCICEVQTHTDSNDNGLMAAMPCCVCCNAPPARRPEVEDLSLQQTSLSLVRLVHKPPPTPATIIH